MRISNRILIGAFASSSGGGRATQIVCVSKLVTSKSEWGLLSWPVFLSEKSSSLSSPESVSLKRLLTFGESQLSVVPVTSERVGVVLLMGRVAFGDFSCYAVAVELNCLFSNTAEILLGSP